MAKKSHSKVGGNVVVEKKEGKKSPCGQYKPGAKISKKKGGGYV